MLHLRLFTVCGLRFDRDDFSPLFQMVILREGDLISARTLAMMNDGRFPVWAGAQGDRLVALRHGFRHHRLHRIVMKQATMVTKDFHYILLPNLCSKRCYFLGNRRQVYQFK